MAQDFTYQPAVYIEQGGKNLVIGTTGTLTVESGGAINLNAGAMTISASSGIVIASTGTLQVASGGAVQIATGGQFSFPVTTQTTTSGTITNFGLTTFGTTIADAYTLADPDRAGLLKILVCTVGGATTVTKVITTASTNVTIAGTSDGSGVVNRTLTFFEAGETAILISSSTTVWQLIAGRNGPTLST